MTDTIAPMCDYHFTVYNEPLNPLFYSSLLEPKFLAHLSAGSSHYPEGTDVHKIASALISNVYRTDTLNLYRR